MKAKLTISVDEDVVPQAKRYAQRHGTSLSGLIERALRDAIASDAPSFSTRWRGRFKPARRTDKRYQLLAKGNTTEATVPCAAALDCGAVETVTMDEALAEVRAFPESRSDLGLPARK
jgi:hypothetical protein